MLRIDSPCSVHSKTFNLIERLKSNVSMNAGADVKRLITTPSCSTVSRSGLLPPVSSANGKPTPPLTPTTFASMPTFTPPTVPPPQATCTAVTSIKNTQVAVWTNFITDESATLEFALKGDCPELASRTVSIA